MFTNSDKKAHKLDYENEYGAMFCVSYVSYNNMIVL